MSAGEFMRTYWQKQPCLLRGALPGLDTLIDRTTLFALACSETVESRLVLERGGDYPWQVLHGPQDAAILEDLPPSHWSLLVQNADLHLRAGAKLLHRFGFIPNWRVDDLMLSCAPTQGSVGPHTDSYDVFLLQISGRRQWKTGGGAAEHDFVPGLDLRILARFEAEREWILEPGDMLYLPPGVAHHGIALDDCITASIGFRAPAPAELLARFAEELVPGALRYEDPHRKPCTRPGEIGRSDLAAVRRLLRGPLADDSVLNHWFGRYITELPEPVEIVRPDAALTKTALRRRLQRETLEPANANRAVYLREAGGLTLFINGREYRLPDTARVLADRLCEGRSVDHNCLGKTGAHDQLLETLCAMYNDGALRFSDGGRNGRTS